MTSVGHICLCLFVLCEVYSYGQIRRELSDGQAWEEFKGSCYTTSSSLVIQPEAEFICASMSAHLASVTSQEEFLFLVNYLNRDIPPPNDEGLGVVSKAWWTSGKKLWNKWVWDDGSNKGSGTEVDFAPWIQMPNTSPPVSMPASDPDRTAIVIGYVQNAWGIGNVDPHDLFYPMAALFERPC